MKPLFSTIMSRYTSDDGSALSHLLGKQPPSYIGMYLGDQAPEKAPRPYVFFFCPSGGTTETSFPVQKDTTLERIGVQFTIHADSLAQVLDIQQAIRDCYDNLECDMGPDEERTGRIIGTKRMGPGRAFGDPSGEGHVGYVEYRFTVVVY